MKHIIATALSSLAAATTLAGCLEPVGLTTEGPHDLADLGKSFSLDDGSVWVAIGDALFTHDELGQLSDASTALTAHTFLGFRQH